MFFVISGAFILFLFGLGYSVANSLHLIDDHSHFLKKFPFILTTGFLVNHLILLLVQSLKFSLLLGVIVSGYSLVSFLIKRKGEFKMKISATTCGESSILKRNKSSLFYSLTQWQATGNALMGGFIRNKDRFPLVVIVFILCLYYFAILLDPLEDWDARSIWFFHAKMIWSAESINMSAGWDHPSLQFSHVDYPKLIPALAAQLSYILGYWNEYMPKLSLFLILIPPIFWVFSFYSRSYSFLFLVLVFPFGLKSQLWNGSMDGYVAFYSAISMLLLGRYFKQRHLLDLMSGMSCLALISNIKNEGILIGLVGMVSIAIVGIYSGQCKLIDMKKFLSLYRVGWLAIIISPCIVWSVVYKYKWVLTNDLQLGTTEAFHRMMSRLSDGVSLPLILKRTFIHDESAVWLALLALIVSVIVLAVSKRHSVTYIPASMTAMVYYWGIVSVYLMTPSDLNLHLATSVQRTMMTFSSLMLVGTYYVLKELEELSVYPISKFLKYG